MSEKWVIINHEGKKKPYLCASCAIDFYSLICKEKPSAKLIAKTRKAVYKKIKEEVGKK